MQSNLTLRSTEHRTSPRPLSRLPAHVTLEAGALVEPLSVVLQGFRRSQFKAGQSCLILGAGAVGLLASAAAKASGASYVAAVDIDAGRLAFAKKNGWADGTILSTGTRGWIPTNYCQVYDPRPIRSLLHALTRMWDYLSLGVNDEALFEDRQDYVQGACPLANPSRQTASFPRRARGARAVAFPRKDVAFPPLSRTKTTFPVAFPRKTTYQRSSDPFPIAFSDPAIQYAKLKHVA